MWFILFLISGWHHQSNATDTGFVGAAQNWPTNWVAALSSSSFKTSLAEFLVSAWSNSNNPSLFEGKILLAICGSICYEHMPTLDKVVRTEERSFLCTYEEVDSCIFTFRF